MMEKPDIKTLLWQAYSGQLTENEWQRIEQWITGSEENKKIASDLYLLYVASAAKESPKYINVEKALGAVNKRIDRESGIEVVSKKKILWSTQMWRVAAAVLIPLFAIVGWQVWANANNTVEYIEIHSEVGKITQITLPDSSKIWLNKNSYIRYPSVFDKDTREVYLEGEAYFSVAKNTDQHFIVTTAYQVQIEVTGTEFNVEAPKEGNQLTTSLVEGAIIMHYQDKQNKTQSIHLKPQQRIEYDEKTGDVSKQDNAFVLTDIGWKDSKIILSNSSLEDLLKLLHKKYEVDFVVKKQSVWNKTFTGTFDDVSLPSVLEMLKISSGIKYKIISLPEDKKGMTIELY